MAYREWIVEERLMNSDLGFGGIFHAKKTLYSGSCSIKIMCRREDEEAVMIS